MCRKFEQFFWKFKFSELDDLELEGPNFELKIPSQAFLFDTFWTYQQCEHICQNIEVFFNIWQKMKLLWPFLWYWTHLHFCKWPTIEQINWPYCLLRKSVCNWLQFRKLFGTSCQSSALRSTRRTSWIRSLTSRTSWSWTTEWKNIQVWWGNLDFALLSLTYIRTRTRRLALGILRAILILL